MHSSAHEFGVERIDADVATRSSQHLVGLSRRKYCCYGKQTLKASWQAFSERRLKLPLLVPLNPSIPKKGREVTRPSIEEW
jgi:hypothetical protein